MPYYITPNYSLALIPKSGCSTFARAVIQSFHPEEENLVQTAAYPQGKNADNQMWQNIAPKERYPSKQVVAFIREPISRFLSAMVQEQLTDVDLAIDSILNSTPLPQRPNARRQRVLSRNAHFAPQIKFVTPTTKLYRFPDHLEQGAAEVGFTCTLLKINPAKREKPSMTSEQEEQVRQIYSEDIALYNSITEPGIITGVVWSQYQEPPPPIVVSNDDLNDDPYNNPVR